MSSPSTPSPTPPPPYYNSPLLDEIHTHFPAILYTPEVFQNFPSLLQYIQRQVRQRYDLFSRGREEYIREHNYIHHRHNIHASPHAHVTEAQNLINEILSPRLNLSANSIIGMLFPGAAAATERATGLPAHVIVRPTQQVINENTEVVTATVRGDCSICQEAYEVGASIRKILFCQHVFHTSCIDTWFTQSVRCPMCRHDIRSSTE